MNEMTKISSETTPDTHVEADRVQQQIIDYLGLRTSDLKFEFSAIDGKIKLDLITINPRHNQSFLFHSTTGTDKVDALKKMWRYVQNYKEKENSYTIQWTTKSDSELHTSYFRASNILDALEKLYYGRDRNTITVFSVVLNPIS
jgi:carbamoylphosphate synthase large subunit